MMMFKRMALQANQIRWQRTLYFVIGLLQFVYAALTAVSANRTIPFYLTRDTGIPGVVLAILFVWAGCRFLRSLTPRWNLLLALIPMAIYNALGAWYVLHGEFNFTGIVAHGGVLMLAALCLIRPLAPRIKVGLSPLISLGMLLYAFGIAAQPNAGTAGYISAQFSPLVTIALAILFAATAGYIFDNHLKPHLLFAAFLPQLMYSCAAAAAHFATPLAVPLNGALSHWLLSTLLVTFVLAEVEMIDGTAIIPG